MKSLVGGCIMLLASSTFSFAGSCQGEKMNKDWCWPTGTSKIGRLLKWHQINSNYGGKHLGVDIKAAENDPVYAIADGVVVASRMDVGDYGGVNVPGGALIIKHWDDNNKPFIVLYGHVKNINVKSKVFRGQKMAEIGPYRDGIVHLHFGVRYPANTENIWKGYWPSDIGFVNPLSFLNSHYPKREFHYIWESAQMFFPRKSYGFGWWPKDVTCVNAEMWMENKRPIDDVDNSVCQEAFDNFLDYYTIINQRDFTDMWDEAFFGDKMNVSAFQCIAR